jgi:glutathione S-transferase
MVDGGRTLVETSIIIEHLALSRPGAAALLPRDPAAALDVRLMDRVFDSYVMTPMLTLAFNESRPAEARDAFGAEQARGQLAKAYAWLDGLVAGRAWAAGDAFTLADCAAAPALLFAHWAHPIPEELARLHAYRGRLLARPSFARVVEEARRFRAAFPFPTGD